MMNESWMIEATERYLKGEMPADERNRFEEQRKSNPELDQFVVAHDRFLQELDHYGKLRRFKHRLHETFHHLSETGAIKQIQLGRIAKMELFWKKYKRTMSIAATIAGIIAIGVNLLTFIVSPNNRNKKVEELVNTVNAIKQKQSEQDNRINSLATSKLPSDKVVTGTGTAFLIDQKGFLVTNAHVVRNAKGAIVTNHKGLDLHARILFSDIKRDIAILKIEDKDYKAVGIIPYGIRKASSDLAEPIFTIGYPDNKFVYGEGYLSSHTGFQNDSLSCQIAVAANPGNSGGPVFNRYGEVIGILSKRELEAEGVVYAIRAKYIADVIHDMREKDNTLGTIKLPVASSLRGFDKTQQVKRIQDYVYMIKGY